MTFLTAKDVAARLNISDRTALRLLARGDIQGFKISGKIWRVSEAELLAYIARQIGKRAA